MKTFYQKYILSKLSLFIIMLFFFLLHAYLCNFKQDLPINNILSELFPEIAGIFITVFLIDEFNNKRQNLINEQRNFQLDTQQYSRYLYRIQTRTENIYSFIQLHGFTPDVTILVYRLQESIEERPITESFNYKFDKHKNNRLNEILNLSNDIIANIKLLLQDDIEENYKHLYKYACKLITPQVAIIKLAHT